MLLPILNVALLPAVSAALASQGWDTTLQGPLVALVSLLIGWLATNLVCLPLEVLERRTQRRYGWIVHWRTIAIAVVCGPWLYLASPLTSESNEEHRRRPWHFAAGAAAVAVIATVGGSIVAGTVVTQSNGFYEASVLDSLEHDSRMPQPIYKMICDFTGTSVGGAPGRCTALVGPSADFVSVTVELRPFGATRATWTRKPAPVPTADPVPVATPSALPTQPPTTTAASQDITPTNAASSSTSDTYPCLTPDMLSAMASYGLTRGLTTDCGEAAVSTVVDNMWSAWYGTRTVSRSEVVASLNGGWVGRDVRNLFGSDAAVYEAIAREIRRRAAQLP